MNRDVEDAFMACFDNICKNYNLPASFSVSEVLRNRSFHNHFHAFVDIHTSSCFNFAEQEIINNLLDTGIKSKKDYRQLRSLIRTRFIDAIYSIRNLTEESLRSLGVKNVRN